MPEYYWTLIIEDCWVQSSIWTTKDSDGGKVAKVLSTSSPVFWETDEDLVTSADTCLSEAIQEFPENEEEPSKVVFGVPASWVSDGNIKAEYLEKIRIICSKLSLEPAGFVVLSEAIAYYLKSEEGSPITAIVIGLGKEIIDVSLFKLGNLVGSVNVARSLSLVEDVTEGLARFPADDHYPSRFVLYDGKLSELELARDTLSQDDWTHHEKVKFLHSPKIEILNPTDKAIAVSLAGASEIAGASIVESNKKVETKDISLEGVTPNYNLEEVANVESQTVDARELGFSLGTDIAGEFAATGAVPESKPDFAINENAPHLMEHQHTHNERVNPIKRQLTKVLAMFSGVTRKLPKLALPKTIMPDVTSHQVRIGHTQLGTSIKMHTLMDNAMPFKIGTVSILVSFVLLFFAWWFLPKADVTIYVSPKKIEKTQTIFIDTKSGSTTGSNTIAGKVVAKEISASGEAATTGTKTVGEKAKGKVQIRNGTASAVKLTASSILVSSRDLKFVPLTSASVSAATSPTSPGTALVEVVAADIGSDYNLAKGESFKVGSFPKSEVDGVADIAFSGGSSRDIQSVSLGDRTKLQEKVTKDLENTGKTSLDSELADGETLLPEGIKVSDEEMDFNHKVGDEASDLKLAMKAEVSAPVVKKQDLVNVAKKALADEIPNGFVLRDDQIKNELEVVSDKGGIIEVEMTMTANLLPSIDPNEVAKNIAGKSPKAVQDYLSTMASFSKVAIDRKPKLPGRLGTLPRITKNINIEITAER